MVTRPAENQQTVEARCLGWGDKEGTCGNAPGTEWGPYWCQSCDRQRIAHLNKRFEEIRLARCARRPKRLPPGWTRSGKSKPDG